MVRRILIFLVFLSLVSCSVRYHIKKGNEALEIYNYFEAVHHFEKGLKKDNFQAHYGLATIYYRNDNPFHSLTHAYYHLTKADSVFHQLDFSKKKNQKLDSLQWEHDLDSLNQNIASAEFVHVLIIDQKELYQRFINQFPEASEIPVAKDRRDQIALENAYSFGTAEAFRKFLNAYPESKYTDEAQRQFDQHLYNESTAKKTLLSYVSFIRNHPESPYIEDAENEIYKLQTEYETLNAYQSFIENYPNNHNVNAAWKKLFSLYMKNEYSKQKLQQFAEDYPDYPFKNELEETLALAELQLLPFEKNGQWGFIDVDGNVVVDPTFDWVEPFSEGMALAGKDGETGYINKRGVWKIKGIEDGYKMSGGVAVVDVNGMFGVIDRSGNYVFQPKYEDIGGLSEGLFYILKGDLYGYANNDGVIVITPKFNFAGDFENNRAQVQMDDLWGVIDRKGSFLIRPRYEELKKFNDTCYIVERDGMQGVLNLKEDTIIPFAFYSIEPESEGLALIENDEGIGYYNVADQKIQIECQFESYPAMATLGAFVNGHAATMKKGKLGFIDKKGKKVIPYIFKTVGHFSDRIPIIKEEQLWGYCDEEADLKIDYQYDKAESFVQNNAVVQVDPFYGVIDKEGEALLEMKYESIERLDNMTFLVKEKGRYGIKTLEKELVPSIYEKHVTIDNRYMRLEKADTFIYFDLTTKKIIR